MPKRGRLSRPLHKNAKAGLMTTAPAQRCRKAPKLSSLADLCVFGRLWPTSADFFRLWCVLKLLTFLFVLFVLRCLTCFLTFWEVSPEAPGPRRFPRRSPEVSGTFRKFREASGGLGRLPEFRETCRQNSDEQHPSAPVGLITLFACFLVTSAFEVRFAPAFLRWLVR